MQISKKVVEKVQGLIEYKKYFDYLEELRKSGETNMFGAGSYLQDEFGLEKKEARSILLAWMDSYKNN